MPRPRTPFRFSTRQLFLWTLIVAVAAAGYGGLRGGGANRGLFVMFVAAAPLVVLVLVALAHEAARLFRRPPSDDRKSPFDDP